MIEFVFCGFLFLTVVVAVVWYWLGLAEKIRHNKKEVLGQRTIAKAKWYGVRLVYNIDHDVVAVCSKSAFDDGLSVHHEKVESGQIKPWEPVVCYANPTFTFAGSKQTFRPIHTGLMCDLKGHWMALILKDATGVSRDQVSRKDFDAAIEQIMPRDTRLFVPYSGNANEKQFAFYGKQELDDFNLMMSRVFRGFK